MLAVAVYVAVLNILVVNINNNLAHLIHLVLG